MPVGAKRCMNWVNPAYQTCLEGGDYDAGDTVVLDADGAYKRKRGPVDALRVLGTSFSVAAFFHVRDRVEIRFRKPHAVDAMSSP